MTGLLNAFYAELVEIVVAHGGDIIKFAGHAVTVVWFTNAEPDDTKQKAELDMATACRRAAECSLELHAKLHEYVAAQGPLPATVDAFMRMIWEQNMVVLVQTTGFVEKGVNKCERYFPENVGETLNVGVGGSVWIPS